MQWYYKLKHRFKDKRRTVIITMRLTEAQRIAFEDMMACWNSLSSMGSSRFTKYYADGDGDFHPSVRINGQKPHSTKLLTNEERWPENGKEYQVDFDIIEWRLHNK